MPLLLKIRIIALGKNKERWITAGVEHYLTLLSRFASVSIDIVPAPKTSSSLPPAQIRRKESALLAGKRSGGYCIALSEKGKQYDSLAFSQLIDKLQVTGGGKIEFLIGGAYGMDDQLLSEADDILSLSDLTFPHQLVRLILLEQIYRAFSILNNTSYHK